MAQGPCVPRSTSARPRYVVAQGSILAAAQLSTLVAVLAAVARLVAVDTLPAWLARAGSAHWITPGAILAWAVPVASFTPLTIWAGEVAGRATPARLALASFGAGASSVNARVVAKWQTSGAVCCLHVTLAADFDTTSSLFSFSLVGNSMSNSVLRTSWWEC